jgi:hypothetical protein
MTSRITFNVGAPTFGVWFTLSSEGQLCCRFCDASHATHFPFWNDASIESPMPLKTKSFHKPSSNTFNVGAPTFSVAHPFRGEVFQGVDNIVLQQRTPSGLKGLSKRQPYSREAVSQ